jgi:catechol 2,3-dioxygenase
MSAVGRTTSDRPAVAIDPGTSMGTVRLTASDLVRSRAFYEQVLGLSASEQQDGTVALAVDGERPLVELRGDSSAAPLERRATGLYHLAILVPSRGDLGFALTRLAKARWPLDGASDHLVSEALYLSDPDGNGIEIYRDRPREEWRQVDGQLAMSTLPLDLQSVLNEVEDAPAVPPLAPAGTRIGHVHLQVADLGEAEEFYNGLLGFDVTVRGYPGALFVSAGGYHHHLGLNTWNSLGAGPPPPGAIGLRSFEIVLPKAEELDRVLARVEAARIEVERGWGGSLIRDPSGNGVLLRAASAPPPTRA